MVLQPCVLVKDYSYCPERYAYSAGGVCEEWLTPVNYGDECGNVGDYSVDYSVSIPNKLPEYLTWLGYASYVVTVKVMVLSEQECEVGFDAYSSNGNGSYDGFNGYQMVYSVLGFTAGLVCAGAYARRRRSKVDAETVEEVRENLGGDYIEMLSGKVGAGTLDASVAVV